MHHHSSEQIHSKGSKTGNIQSCQSLARPLGLLAAPRKNSYSAEELLVTANRYHRKGKLSQAEDIFRKILELVPNHPVALHFLGVIALESGNPCAAIKLIKSALKIAPDYHTAYNNLGNAYSTSGQFEDAADSYSRALEHKPDYSDAMFNLGLMKQMLRKYEEAKDILVKCAEQDPRRADVHSELGFTWAKLGNHMQAQICFQIALSIDPDYTPETRVALGNLFQTVGRFDESVEQYDVAIEQDEKYTRALNAKGMALRRTGNFDASLDTILKAEDINPTNIETLNQLGSAYQSIGDNYRAAEVFRRAVQLDPDSDASRRCLLFIILNDPALTSQERYDIHIDVQGDFNKPEFTKKDFPERDRNTSRRLKVGYISSDFRKHVVAMNVLPVIANHDHEAFEVFLYGEVEFPDEFTEDFKGHADHWRSTMQKPDQEVAAMIEEDEIDVLVFLAGRFDSNRPTVATYRPAPIQVSFHDAATSGLEAMDYWLTDDILHPSDTPELFTEELYRLPQFYQYPVHLELPEIKPAPSLCNGFVTFGCYNKPEKINNTVIELWAEVLREIPDSRLLLKYYNHYSEPSMKERWISRFRDNGISEDRLIFKFKIDIFHN